MRLLSASLFCCQSPQKDKVVELIDAIESQNKQPKPKRKTSKQFLAKPVLAQRNELSKTKQDNSQSKPQVSKYLGYLGFLRPNDPAQVIVNSLLVVLAFLTWRVYESQLDTTQTDERAWIRVDLVNQPKEPDSAVVVDPSQPLSANIGITNTGKTVAKSIYVDACVEILDNTSPAQAAWMSSCYSRPHYRVETGMLFPGTSIGNAQMQKVNRKTVPEPPTSNQSEQFTAGKSYVVVFGRAHYIDVFGKSRWTQFCFPASRASFLSEAARQCVNFASEGQGDYDDNYAEAG